LRDRAADHDPCAAVDAGQAIVEHRASDVIEEDVDAVGRMLAQLGAEVAVLVVDRAVEAKLLDEYPALVGAAGRACVT